MHKLLAQFSAARRMPAGLVTAKLLRRAGIRTSGVSRWELLADPRTADVDRLGRFYLDFAKLAESHGAWPPFDPAGARVLEVGCGPLAGLGPFFIAAGAARYVGIDPGVDPAQLVHPQLVERYLAPAIEGARGLQAGNGAAPVDDAVPDASTFFARSDFFRGGLEAFPNSPAARAVTDNGGLYDAAVSISCFEHIGELDSALAALREVLAPGARQLHLVNFSNHLDKAAPFKHLYDLTPEQHRARYGAHINLLRAPDMLAAFRAAGFEASLVPVDVRPEAVPTDTLAPCWRERYSLGDLAIRTALILV